LSGGNDDGGMMLYWFPSTARDAYLLIRHWGLIISLGTLVVGPLASTATALSMNVWGTPEGILIEASEEFISADHVYARVYWTWCFAEFAGSSQQALGDSWT
jgi:hypothetical protein